MACPLEPLEGEGITDPSVCEPYVDPLRRDPDHETIHGTRRDAEKALTRILREVDTGQAVATSGTTLGRYLTDTWLPHMRTRVRPKTWNRYEGLVRVHVMPRVGRRCLSSCARWGARSLRS